MSEKPRSGCLADILSIAGTIAFLEVIKWVFGVGISLVVSLIILAAILGFMYGVGYEKERLAPTPDAKE